MDRKDSELHFTEVDLYETVSECMEVLSVNAKQRNVTIELEGKTSIVCGNKDMLKELVENLGQNAIRYNNPNGKVKISVGTIDGQVALTVKDNGIGIPVSEAADEFLNDFIVLIKADQKLQVEQGLVLRL